MRSELRCSRWYLQIKSNSVAPMLCTDADPSVWVELWIASLASKVEGQKGIDGSGKVVSRS